MFVFIFFFPPFSLFTSNLYARYELVWKQSAVFQPERWSQLLLLVTFLLPFVDDLKQKEEKASYSYLNLTREQKETKFSETMKTAVIWNKSLYCTGRLLILCFLVFLWPSR